MTVQRESLEYILREDLSLLAFLPIILVQIKLSMKAFSLENELFHIETNWEFCEKLMQVCFFHFYIIISNL